MISFNRGKLLMYFLYLICFIITFILFSCAPTQQTVKENDGSQPQDSTAQAQKQDSTVIATQAQEAAPAAPAQIPPAPEVVAPPAPAGDINSINIPAGEFTMGVDKGGDLIEAPSHKVILDSYYIDKSEVTNADYKKFIDNGGYNLKEIWSNEGWAWKEKNNITAPQLWNDSKYNEPDQPVCGVSYYEAEAYAHWAGKRLPTEAEWEKAARGTDGRMFPWGNEYKKNLCNNKDAGNKKPIKVCSYPDGVSPFGVHDMAGNLNEWCSDFFDRNYYKNSPLKNPKGPEKGTDKVIKGGGFSYDSHYCRTTRRGSYSPSQRSSTIGFRCVKDNK
ncbi:formylglycine-generating enzyme family protein [Candidatus Poribacteria bacterium]|nr:formylglycine-generating enzyme family protein [Candidatus Poribacteria bacterium]